MLSVNIQKDIGEYTEKVMLGLSARSLASIAVGGGLACAIAFLAVGVLGIEVSDVALPIMAVALACFACGFVRPLGLPFETAARLYLDEWFGCTLLSWKSAPSLALEQAVADARRARTAALSGADRRAERKRIRRYRKSLRGRGASSPELVLPRAFGEEGDWE